MSKISWTNKYPSKDELKKDISIMLNIVKSVVIKKYGKTVLGIYFKGSASKTFDTLLDFVPDMSDVDVHVLFKNNDQFYSKLKHPLNSLEMALLFEKIYFQKNPKFVHHPKVQLMSINEFEGSTNYRSTPRAAVKVVYGVDYPEKNLDKKLVKKLSIEQLRLEKKFLKKFITRVMDIKSRSIAKYAQELSYHVGPSAANYLVTKGFDYSHAFSLNRTAIYKEILKLDKKLARDFAMYYYYGWQNYLYPNYGNGKNMIKHGFDFLKRVSEV